MTSLSVPYLILPYDDADVEDSATRIDRIIFNFSENMLYLWKNMFNGHEDAWCVGSSCGWLIMLDNKGCPYLLNPPSSYCIQLPPFSNASIHCAGVSHSYFIQNLKTFVSKAVLMRSPSPSQYTLAILFSQSGRLAFCNNALTWVELTGTKGLYSDIVFHNNNLYLLVEDWSVEKWDFRQEVPRKIQDLKPTVERDEEEEREFPRGKFSSKIYLVMFEEELLLVKRFIGNYVNADGEVVYEGYRSSSYEGGEEICPYRTKHFVVYKLDFMNNKWVKKSSLGNHVLFLGINESILVSTKMFKGCESNSIYFTDDRWEEMNLDSSYGGHDWGVFNLEDKIFKLLAPYPWTNKMDPPPIWMVPT